MTVEWVRLADVLELIRRPVAVALDEQYVEVGVRSFGKGLFRKEPVSGADLGSKRVFHLVPGSLVVNIVFAWEGAISCSDQSHEGLIGSHRFLNYLPRSDRVTVDYVTAYLLSERGLADLGRASPGSAGRNRTLSIGAFENISLPLVSSGEQARVAALLAAAQRISAAAVLAANRVDAELAAMVDRILQSVSGRVSMGDLVTPVSDAERVDPDTVYVTAGMYNRGRGLFARPPIRGSETRYRYLTPLKAGQLVYSKLTCWQGAVTITGPENDGTYVSSEFPVFVPNDAHVAALLRHVVTQTSFVEQMKRVVTGMGNTRQRVNPDRFLSLEVPLPDDRERELLMPLLDRAEAARRVARDRATKADALVAATRNHVFDSLIR